MIFWIINDKEFTESKKTIESRVRVHIKERMPFNYKKLNIRFKKYKHYIEIRIKTIKANSKYKLNHDLIFSSLDKLVSFELSYEPGFCATLWSNEKEYDPNDVNICGTYPNKEMEEFIDSWIQNNYYDNDTPKGEEDLVIKAWKEKHASPKCAIFYLNELSKKHYPQFLSMNDFKTTYPKLYKDFFQTLRIFKKKYDYREKLKFRSLQPSKIIIMKSFKLKKVNITAVFDYVSNGETPFAAMRSSITYNQEKYDELI